MRRVPRNDEYFLYYISNTGIILSFLTSEAIYHSINHTQYTRKHATSEYSFPKSLILFVVWQEEAMHLNYLQTYLESYDRPKAL